MLTNSVNVVFILGSERLYSDLSPKYSHRTEDSVSVVRLDKSGGCVSRDETYMKALRQTQIRAYFFGSGENTLGPHSVVLDFADLSIFRIIERELGFLFSFFSMYTNFAISIRSEPLIPTRR
jgi:polyribonucleotide 5'-hydroxyl-kinase